MADTLLVGVGVGLAFEYPCHALADAGDDGGDCEEDDGRLNISNRTKSRSLCSEKKCALV
jgi:hypothetical protein